MGKAAEMCMVRRHGEEIYIGNGTGVVRMWVSHPCHRVKASRPHCAVLSGKNVENWG